MNITERSLIQRLVDELEHATGSDYQKDLKAKARAFLAQPKPEWPTDQELRVFVCKWWEKFVFPKNEVTYACVLDEIDPEHFVDFLRDALAHWNT
jgi:hypothetical protein